MSGWFEVVYRMLNKAGDAFIEPRREDGHGSDPSDPTYVEMASGGLATETTLNDLLTAFNNEDFATETTLAALSSILSSIDSKDFATETTLAALSSILSSIDAKDFATETTLAALGAILTNINNAQLPDNHEVTANQGTDPWNVSIANSLTTVVGPITRSGPYLTTDGTTYSAVIDWLDPSVSKYEQGFFSSVATSLSDINIAIAVESSNDISFPASETHTGYSYTQKNSNRRFPLFYYGFRYTRIRYEAPVNDLTDLTVEQAFTKGFSRSTPRQFGRTIAGDSHHDFTAAVEVTGVNELTGNSDPVGLTQNLSLRVADENTARTPNGSVWSEGIRNDVTFEFGSEQGPSDLARLQDLSSGGALSIDSSEGQAVFTTLAAPGSTVRVLSDGKINYSPAQGIRYDLTAQPVVVPVGDQYYEWGISDISGNNATGYRYDANGLAVFRRKNGNIEYLKYQADWNRNRCLGEARDKYQKDGVPTPLVPTNNQRYFGQHEWLGAASMTKGVKGPSNFFIETDVEEYAGTATGSTLPSASLYVYMQAYNGAGGELELRSGSWRGGIFTSESDVKVIQVTDDILLRPLGDSLTQQITVGTTPVRIDMSQVANRRSIAIRNVSSANCAFGNSSSITYDSGSWPLFGASKDGYTELAPNEQEFWAVAEDTGATETTLRRSPSVAPTGTATSPGNAQTSDDTRAIMDAVAETISSSSYTAGTANDLVSVKIGLEARKDPATLTETVQQVNSDFTGTSTGNSVTALNVTPTAKCLYLAKVAMRDTSVSVNVVTGLGLTWQEAGAAVSNSTTKVHVWYAYGSPLATGNVTATLSGASNSAISVSKFSGADQDSPIESFESLTGSSTSYSDSLNGSALGVLVVAAACNNQTHTAGSGGTETSEISVGSGSNTITLASTVEFLAAAGAESYSGSFSGSANWSTAAVTIRPAEAEECEVSMTYAYSGSPGATSGTLTFDSFVDSSGLIDISADRAWAAADIANITDVSAELLSKGAANLQVDHIFVEIADSTGASARLVVRQLGEPNE